MKPQPNPQAGLPVLPEASWQPSQGPGRADTCRLPFRAGVVFFPLWSCRFFLKGPRYSFQVLSQLSDKKQTEKAALTISPRAKARTVHKYSRSSGMGPKTKVQAGSRW